MTWLFQCLSFTLNENYWKLFFPPLSFLKQKYLDIILIAAWYLICATINCDKKRRVWAWWFKGVSRHFERQPVAYRRVAVARPDPLPLETGRCRAWVRVFLTAPPFRDLSQHDLSLASSHRRKATSAIARGTPGQENKRPRSCHQQTQDPESSRHCTPQCSALRPHVLFSLER